MTYINNDQEDEATNSIALDFSHKIRQYFNGNSDECQIPKILETSPWLASEITSHFAKLELIFTKVAQMKKRVQRELVKA